MANTTTKNFQDAASNVADKSKEVASTVADKAKDFASSAADRAKELGKSAAHAVDNAAAKVGSGMETAADKIRDKGPHEGFMGTAASKVADTMESSGRYLERQGFTGMADDVTETIKRNPLPALLIALGVGFLIGRALRS